MIDKDTMIFGSFAKEAGNNGCKMFNPAFEYYGLNAIYKSFSVDDIGKAIESARTLNFMGFGITMPFKKEAIKYIDSGSSEIYETGSINTVVNINGVFKGFNTDYLAAMELLKKYPKKFLYILGNGGYAAAVKHAADILEISNATISRKDWINIEQIRNSIIYNCTPVTNIKVDNSNDFIDCIVTTPTGYELSRIQASYQFKLYTGLEFPPI